MPIDLTSTEPGEIALPEVKAAFFDLDGTIVDASGNITESSLEAIRLLRSAGIKIGLATGRPMFGAASIIRQLEINEQSLFFSGSLVTNPASGNTLIEKGIEPARLTSLCDTLRESGLFFELYTRDSFYVEKENRRISEIHFEYIKRMPEKIRLSTIIGKKPILKIVPIAESEAEMRTLSEITPSFRDLCFATSKGHAHPHIEFGNITHKDASRHRAFETLCSHLSITPAQVASFGDAEADVPFLEMAGLGTAMGNAAPAVQRAAKYVTRSVDEGGVLHAVELLLGR